MNKRQRKKQDALAIQLAKKIIYLVGGYPDGYPKFWKCNSETSRNFMKYGLEYYEAAIFDFKAELLLKESLLKVCRKCIIDDFPLQDYYLFEIPYGDSNGCFMDFVHSAEYDSHHSKPKENDCIHEIDFWCGYNSKLAIPQGTDKICSQFDCDTCQDAVYKAD